MSEYEKEMVDLYKKSLGEKQDFKGIVCPQTYKRSCRLCELCKEVLFKKLPKEDLLRLLASRLNSKERYYSNIIFLAEPTEIVVLEYGPKIFKQLLAMQMDETASWKDFMQPMTGRNLIIERMVGATREQTDYYVKPKDPSKLTNMEVLNKLINDPKYNLTNIIDNIESGGIKPLYQSKLDKRVEIRILPSWLGPEYMAKFFQKVDYHYNISEEEFRATLAGEINPVRLVTALQEIPKKQEEKKPIPTAWGAKPSSTSVGGTSSYGVSKMEVPTPKSNVPDVSFDSDTDFPPCYGDYDEGDQECIVKCKGEAGWADGCKAYRDEKLSKRRRARSLSK